VGFIFVYKAVVKKKKRRYLKNVLHVFLHNFFRYC
jgi:hypothetical protein